MTIIVKNKQSLFFDDFNFKCCIGKKGLTENKIEGDKKTPKGFHSLGNLYYRGDKVKKPKTLLKCVKIKYERLFRNDYKYNYLIPIKYNWRNPKKNKGSAIFIHLTKNYKPTAGCIALLQKDFLILVKLIKKNTRIKII